MAAIALEKLEDQLTCAICLDTYTNPKLLQCHHVYCQQCLVRLVDRDQQGQLILTCPSCRQVTPVPARGVAGLQEAFHVNQLLEIVEEHKKTNIATVIPKGVSTTHHTPRPENTTTNCPEHDGRKVELYCRTCEETICFKCIMKDGKHHSHNYEELNTAFERYKTEITSSLAPLEMQLLTIKKAFAQLDAHCDDISDQQAVIEANIHITITQLHESLDVRRTELISQLHQITQAKLKSLQVQRDQLEMIQVQLSSCLHFIRENLKTGCQEETLLKKKTTVKRVEELTTSFQLDTLKPNTSADMVFSVSADFVTECQVFGKMYAVSQPDPSKCYAKGTLATVVGEESSVILHTFDYNNEPCKEYIDIRCVLVSEITDSKTESSIKRRGENQYEISYQPKIKGKQKLHIKIWDQHIRGSPFPVTEKEPVEKLGTPILTISGVEQPAGISINQKGEVVVAEWNGHCISIFNSKGEKLRSFGSYGDSGHGKFQSPRGVAIDSEDNILVTDSAIHCVQRFTAQGDFLSSVGTKAGTGPLQFDHPMGIASNASNNMVYIGNDNGSVQILNPNLSYHSAFGKRGSGKSQFNDPRLIACDSTGNVYVADCNNHRIQVFTAKGKFLRMFGKQGEGRGELYWPCGVAVDSSNMVYVSELHNNRVSIFTSEGYFVTSFGSQGEGPGEFNRPYGLAVDSCGVVYVCDYNNNRVQIF